MKALKFLIGIIITLSFLSQNNVIAQKKLNGKSIIEGNWKGQNIEYVAGQINIKVSSEATINDILTLLSSFNATLVDSIDILGWGLIEVSEETNVFFLIDELFLSGLFETLEPNSLLTLNFEPDDYLFRYGFQWALRNNPNYPPYGTQDADIDITEAWDKTMGSPDIIIGILDSGIPMQEGLLSHQDLDESNRIILGADFIDMPGDPRYTEGVRDRLGHGTHVAGIIGAETNNLNGIAGIAPNSKLIIVQVFDDQGFGTPTSFKDGVLYAVNNGCRIINFSGGISGHYDIIEDAILYAFENNVLITISAGNKCGGAVLYPAKYSSIGTHSGFENGYTNVIAISATDHHDLISNYSSIGTEVNVSAPGGHGTTNCCASFCMNYDSDDIISTTPNYPFYIRDLHPEVGLNYGYLAGTSMAAPHVAGIAALLVSVNPNLSPLQIRDIIQLTADDKGTIGRDDYYGWGRVNANQAVLLALAYANKSASYDATSHNNNHILERGYFGKLHKVFFSGGEIFYRRSSNNGTSWEITKRISNGNGSNNHPSIVAGVGSTDVLRLVWQRKLDDTHYEIWYSYSNNSGTDWSIPAIVPGCTNVAIQYYQSNPGAGPGPTPVVASFFRGGAEGTPSYLLVYAEQSGLRFRYANDNNLSWTIPANDIVPQSNYSSMTWYPCLATYNSQGNNVNLIYDDRFTHVYSQIYNGDGTWSNRVFADGVGTYNRMSSLALDYTNNMLGVWSGWNSTTSNYVIRFRQGFANNTWSSWAKEWSTSGTNSFGPVVSYYNQGGSYPYGIDILWYNALNQIRQKKYYGLGDIWIPSDPNTQLLFSNGLFANLTHERQNTTYPKQTYTDQTTQPYSMMDNSSNLPKENLVVNGSNYRAAEISDTVNHSSFRLEIKEPIVTLTTGEKIVIPFKDYNYKDTLDLSTTNVFDYLQTKSFYIPNNAQSVTFKVNLSASQPDTNSNGSLNTTRITPFRNVSFKLLAKDNSLITLLSNIGSVSLNNINGIFNYSKEFSINALALRNKNVFIIPQLTVGGTYTQNSLLFTLINLSVEENSIAKDSIIITQNDIIPTEYGLEQNYPNPFNPITQINFSILNAGMVTLKVFDMLGREVAVLVNEEKSQGIYTVSFNGSNLSSGIYFYTLQTGSFKQTRKMLLLK